MPRVPDAVLVHYPDASLIEIRPQFTQFEQCGGGVRGSVKGFTKQSRRRMQNLLNRIERDAFKRAKLITLTYRENERDHIRSKQHLNRFLNYLRRNHVDHSGVWRLEHQARGAIHYHILTFGRYIPNQTIAEAWTRIAAPGDKQHLAAGTEIRAVRRARSGVAYVSKYMGKISGEPERDGSDKMFRGRFWGVFNRRALPLARGKTVVLQGQRASEASERIARDYGFKSRPGCVVRLYTSSPLHHQTELNKILGEDHES